MDEKEMYKLLSFVKRSGTRKEILESLSEPKTPSELVDVTDVKLSNVSRALGELKNRGLVKVINPQDRKFRYYKLTEKSEEILKEVE